MNHLLLALPIWVVFSFTVAALWIASDLIYNAYRRWRTRRRTVHIAITGDTSQLVRELERVDQHLQVIGGHRGPDAPMGQVKL